MGRTEAFAMIVCFGSWSCEKALAETDRPAVASLAAWVVSFCQFWLFCHLGAGLALSGTGSGVMMTGGSSLYLRFKLSFRDLVEMIPERGISLAHTTIMRWIQRYVPEFEKRWNRLACRAGASWRVDETSHDDVDGLSSTAS